MFKLFSRKKKMNEMAFLMDCFIEDCDDLLEDIDDLQISFQESNKLLATIGKQCDEIIARYELMDKRDKTKTLADVLESCDRIDKIIDGFDKGDIND